LINTPDSVNQLHSEANPTINSVPYVKVEALQALLLEVQQESGVAERELATFLGLLAARKILEEECARLQDEEAAGPAAQMLRTSAN
jgi:hypothetical protein